MITTNYSCRNSRVRNPGPAAADGAERGRVRADPDPARRAAAGHPLENARAAAPYAWAVLTAALDAALYRFRTRCRVSESSAGKLLKHGG
jgi:hypothetical protein